MFVCAATGLAHEARGVAFVDAQERAVAVAQGADLVQLRDRAVHGKHTVGEHQLEARAFGIGLLQATLQVGHLVVLVAPALGLAQANAVDDGGVVELVADDGVGLAQQRFEQTAVGVKSGRVQDGVFGAQESGQTGFQGFVQVLCAANEAHRTQAITVGAQGFVRGLDHGGVAREPEVVVGAQVDDLAAIGRLDLSALVAGDDAFAFHQALGLQALQFGLDVGQKIVRCVHGGQALQLVR